MRFVLYARKSSESEDRQVQSIDDQLRVLNEVAVQRSLSIMEEVTESKSAKDPGERPEFQRVLKMIERGRADGILCWSINRLSRNPIESGRLSWMLQKGILKIIQTPERSYLPEDNVLLFTVETGMANQYVLDLSKAVKRGMDSKVAKGWFPHRAPEGYNNELREHIISEDPERFALLQRAWRLLLPGTTAVPQVLELLNDEWGYRTRPNGKHPGGPLSRSAAYRLFTNIFYTGYFEHGGVTHKGQHKPMITLDEYETIQRHLRRQIRKTHYHKNYFAYNGLITCASCGHSVTASVHPGRHGRGRYVYYSCANRAGLCGRRGLREEALEEQINDYLRTITITSSFAEIVREELEVWIKQDLGGQESIYEQQMRVLNEHERMLDELLDMRLRQLVDDTLFREKQRKLHKRVGELRLAIERTQSRLDRTRDIIHSALDFRMHAHEQFLIGDAEKRRNIARALGISYIFDSCRVHIEPNPLLIPMQPPENPSTGADLAESPATVLGSVQNVADSGKFEPRKRAILSTKRALVGHSVSGGCPAGTDSETAEFQAHWHGLFLQVADGDVTFANPF